MTEKIANAHALIDTAVQIKIELIQIFQEYGQQLKKGNAVDFLDFSLKGEYSSYKVLCDLFKGLFSCRSPVCCLCRARYLLWADSW